MDLHLSDGNPITFYPRSNFTFRYGKKPSNKSPEKTDPKESSQTPTTNIGNEMALLSISQPKNPRNLKRLSDISDTELSKVQKKLMLPWSKNDMFVGAFEICELDTGATRLISKFTQKNYNYDNFRHEYARMHFNEVISEVLNDDSMTGYSPLFYAMATGCPRTLEYCLSLGGDPNAVGGPKELEDEVPIPILAFTLAYDLPPGVSTEMVRYLLSYGAKPTNIPDMSYTPVVRPEDWKVPQQSISSDTNIPSWCTTPFWNILALKPNLTQRYMLDRAKRSKPPSARQKQVTKAFKLQPLNSVIYHLIGQEYALERVTREITLQCAQAYNNGKPLVLVFAGPSGSGKTELANSLGDLLSISYRIIDCTKISHKSDMFGAQAPYYGSEKGSSLNNHIVDNDGKTNVVFLDEFEKVTNPAILNGFLKPFDEGIWYDSRDRNHSTTICCKKTIWVLAVNSLDDYGKRFYEEHLAPGITKTSDQLERDLKAFEKLNKKRLACIFGIPLVGRIASIIPFFPFKPVESAVLAHKYILNIQSNVTAPVDVKNKKFVGNIDLQLPSDSMVCTHIAETEYIVEEGARSIARGVRAVEHELTERYLEKDVEITDKNNTKPKDVYVLDTFEDDGKVAGWELRQRE